MNPLQIEDRGLLIPPEYLAGLPRHVRVRPIKGGIVIESADQAEARDLLQSMVERLRAVAAEDPLDPSEIADLVDDIPDGTLLALKLSDATAAAEIRLAAAVKLYELGRLSSGAAARLAGLPRVLFLSKLAEYGVDTFCLCDDELKRQTHLV
jgi:predicted HTH domain antitoxin